MADFITNDLVLSESPSTGYSRQRKCFFHSEIFMLRSYNFLHNARPLARCTRSSPPISTLAWDIFPQPLATLRAPLLTNARPTKKNGALSRQMCPHSEKTPQLFSPLAPPLFSPSAIPRARRRARSHTHSASFRFLPSPHGDSRTTH